jgi:hypothetical protein
VPPPEVKIVRNKLGPIPDDYFENDPIYPPPKNSPPLSKELEDWVKDHGSDKYSWRPLLIVAWPFGLSLKILLD